MKKSHDLIRSQPSPKRGTAKVLHDLHKRPPENLKKPDPGDPFRRLRGQLIDTVEVHHTVLLESTLEDLVRHIDVELH
jgi:hypothetical protein